MSKFYSPLRYPGGKNSLFSFFADFFYENNLIGINYAEPYAGGAGLALRLLMEEYVSNIYINDLDRAIYALWYAILNHTEQFCSWIEDVDISIENWKHYKNIQKERDVANLVELAKSTFFLNRTNVSGVIKGGVIGGFNQEGKYKIDVRFKKNELIKRIMKISEFKKRIFIKNDDGLTFIRSINRKKRDFFIYLDPPYYQKGADLYMNFYSREDHIRLSKYVNNLDKKWMVSYDNHQFILDLYSNRRRLIHKFSQSTSNRVGNEVIVFSDKMKFEKSMNTLNAAHLV